jgi:hypothetical protein
MCISFLGFDPNYQTFPHMSSFFFWEKVFVFYWGGGGGGWGWDAYAHDINTSRHTNHPSLYIKTPRRPTARFSSYDPLLIYNIRENHKNVTEIVSRKNISSLSTYNISAKFSSQFLIIDLFCALLNFSHHSVLLLHIKI